MVEKSRRDPIRRINQEEVNLELIKQQVKWRSHCRISQVTASSEFVNETAGGKFGKNKQEPKDKQNERGASSSGPQDVSATKVEVDSRRRKLSRARAGTETSAQGNKAQ